MENNGVWVTTGTSGEIISRRLLPLVKWIYKKLAHFDFKQDNLTLENLYKTAIGDGFNSDDIAESVTILIKLGAAKIFAGEDPHAALKMEFKVWPKNPLVVIPKLIWGDE